MPWIDFTIKFEKDTVVLFITTVRSISFLLEDNYYNCTGRERVFSERIEYGTVRYHTPEVVKAAKADAHE